MNAEKASKTAMKPRAKKAAGTAAKMDGDGIEARMREILDEAASITEMAIGCIITNRNRTKRKDGSVHVSKEHYTFKYRGANGGWKWKRIPARAVGRLRGLVKNGRRFMEIEAEYAALATELALSGKKTDAQPPAAAGNGKRRGAGQEA